MTDSKPFDEASRDVGRLAVALHELANRQPDGPVRTALLAAGLRLDRLNDDMADAFRAEASRGDFLAGHSEALERGFDARLALAEVERDMVREELACAAAVKAGLEDEVRRLREILASRGGLE